MSAALAIELLRTHVTERAAPPLLQCAQLERLSQSACNPKVRDLEIAALIHHQVRRLQIAMNNPRAIVRVIERITKLSDPDRQLVRPKDFLFLSATQTGEGLAIHILHGNAAGSLVMHEVVNSNDVWMSQFQRAPGLALQIV